MMIRILCLGCLILLQTPGSVAQTPSGGRIAGYVTDATTGEPLPGATLQVEGKLRGTVTNKAGRFQLRVDSFPVTLLVRFIGYRSESIELAQSSGNVAVELHPSMLELPELVISGEDPAIRIMRRVIEEKERMRETLDTYRVDAYNRFRMANDTGIVSIWESQTRAFWDRERGVREVSLWQERTENMDVDELLPAALFVQNLYDDNIDVAGHNLMGVTHPDALNHYTFRLEGVRALDNQQVFDISVEPRRRTGTGFEGMIAVLDSTYALLTAQLKPSESFLFPPPIERLDVLYNQQFSAFGGDIWLPVDFRADVQFDVSFGFVLNFPTFRISQLSRLSDFKINVALPDSIFETDSIVLHDSTFAESIELASPEDLRVPLTAREQVAYATIDSTMTLEKAYQPRGLLARFVDAEDGSGDSNGSDGSVSAGLGGDDVLPGVDVVDITWRPDARITRVEGLRAGLGVTVSSQRSVRALGGVAYLTGAEELNWKAGLSAGDDYVLTAMWEDGVQTRYTSPVKGSVLNSARLLYGGPDYFDYYHSRGWRASLSGSVFENRNVDARLTVVNQTHRSLTQTSGSLIFGIKAEEVPNAAVAEGEYRSAALALSWKGDTIPFGIGVYEKYSLSVERSLGGSAISGEGFWQIQAVIMDRVDTFFKRRLLPNVLDFRLSGGWSFGDLPVQRLGIVDGSSTYKEFGTMRTLLDRPYQGDRWFQASWEHSFRTIPFELIGWRYAARRSWNVLLTGGHAWSHLGSVYPTNLPVSVKESDGFHHELGVSLSGLFKLIRIDVAWRLTEPGVSAGIGLARIF